MIDNFINKMSSESKYRNNIFSIKNICHLQTGNSISDSEKINYLDKDDSIFYISSKDIVMKDNSIDYSDCLYIKKHDTAFKTANKNSILLCIEGGSAGKKITYLNDSHAFVNKLCNFEMKNGNNKFLYYFLQSHYFQLQFMSNLSGLISGVSINQLKYLRIIVPNIKEQNYIATQLDRKIPKIENLIKLENSTIQNLNKYKESLIDSSVKGAISKCSTTYNSNIDWIGEIPSSWKLVRLKSILENVNIKNSDDNAELLSLYTHIGVRPRKILEEKGNKNTTVIGYKKVDIDNIVVNKLLAWMGAISISKYKGVTSPDYEVFKVRQTKDVFPDYLNYTLRTKGIKTQCRRNGRGIMLMRWRTYPDDFLNIKIPLPTFDEQHKIVKYLDKKLSQIDKIITLKERKIQKLSKYKATLINDFILGKECENYEL